ncbi:hypothetical protein P9A28_gp32 [Sphingomonas phage Eidolon]|uniref:Uncharacterized protein n=1 Tax=Sphingomonas phage Eidolon TaxID=2686311 RepID=A0A6M3T805_9CAUD|nr:hypothetical protein P9A28_gp32 [Sphingomonas phage Eidolon]QJD54418.1 hypothetical protein [Sphingomonas phage Eidolon]
MFIGISCKYLDAQSADFRMRTFDASRIVMIETHNEIPDETVFWFDDGFQGYALTTDSYDVGGLVELVMQARMNPDEFLPSRYVGKSEGNEPSSTGSLRWKANERAK